MMEGIPSNGGSKSQINIAWHRKEVKRPAVSGRLQRHGIFRRGDAEPEESEKIYHGAAQALRKAERTEANSEGRENQNVSSPTVRGVGIGSLATLEKN
jgi:hypothetical protein